MMNNVCEVFYNTRLEAITFCKYNLYISGKSVDLSFPQLLQLRANLRELTSPEKLEEIIETDNFVLLFMADKGHLFFLEIEQLLDLKDEISFFFEDFKSVSF